MVKALCVNFDVRKPLSNQQIQRNPRVHTVMTLYTPAPSVWSMSFRKDRTDTGMQMEDNGVDFPRPGRAPVRGERPLRAPGYPEADAVALHGLGLVPMDMSEDEDTDEDDSDEDDNPEEVRLCSLYAEAIMISLKSHQNAKGAMLCAMRCH